MKFLSVLLALTSGVFAAMVVCRAISLKLWADLACSVIAMASLYGAIQLAADEAWPLSASAISYLLFVLFAHGQKVASRPQVIPISELHKVWGRGK